VLLASITACQDDGSTSGGDQDDSPQQACERLTERPTATPASGSQNDAVKAQGTNGGGCYNP
jgi:hypothetical protein